MILTTKQNFGLDNRSRPISLSRCLVDPHTTPRGGWQVSFIIKTIKMPVVGSSPRDVFTKSRKLLSDNGIVLSDLDLWFSLNFQWMDRVPDNAMVVHPTLLRKYAEAAGEQSTPTTYHHPREWGSIEWNAMANYLNVDPGSYQFSEFLQRCESALKLLNPAHASRLGCVDCFREFSGYVAALRMNPLHNLEDAKQWLFNTHNEVNARLDKEVITYDKAKSANLWT